MAIPDRIIVTWKNNNVPGEILQRIQRLNPNKELVFYNDINIISYLGRHYGEKYVNFFKQIKRGMFKADFFRLCYLYRDGGYYMDIDIEPLVPFAAVIHKKTSFFTILSAVNRPHVFQALLFSAPKNPIIGKCIEDMLAVGPNIPESGIHADHPTVAMYNNICRFLGTQPVPGIVTHKDITLQLGAEILDPKRYPRGSYLADSGRRHIATYGNLRIAFSRYLNYHCDLGFITLYDLKKHPTVGRSGFPRVGSHRRLATGPPLTGNVSKSRHFFL